MPDRMPEFYVRDGSPEYIPDRKLCDYMYAKRTVYIYINMGTFPYLDIARPVSAI